MTEQEKTMVIYTMHRLTHELQRLTRVMSNTQVQLKEKTEKLTMYAQQINKLTPVSLSNVPRTSLEATEAINLIGAHKLLESEIDALRDDFKKLVIKFDTITELHDNLETELENL